MLPVLALSGPTASGKSTLAVEVASRLAANGQPAEIVNADSMLVYRGMDIGTAKPTLAERRGVVHHLVDIMDIAHSASVAEFQRLARAAIADCRQRDALPIVVGGSALYMRAILDVFEFPRTDPDVRARWEAQLTRSGAAALHAVLATRQPEVARDIEPGNGRRIVRALEVIELTGSFQPTLPALTYAVEGVVHLGLSMPRDTLDARIAARVDHMAEAGFSDEVRGLLRYGLRDAPTASRALGYREMLAFLDGDSPLEDALKQTQQRTRRFARKQEAWFRRDPRIRWVNACVSDPAATVLHILTGKAP